MSGPRRVLLLVPARSYRAADFMLAATRMGLDLTVASDGALPLGRRPVIPIRPGTPIQPGTAGRIASRAGSVDAVVAVDAPMLVLAAEVAARLGLPHNPVDAVLAAADKARQRTRWAAIGVAQPRFEIVPAQATDDDIRQASKALGFPCVVKAVSLSASQGVLRADDPEQAVRAAARIRRVLAEARRPADRCPAGSRSAGPRPTDSRSAGRRRTGGQVAGCQAAAEPLLIEEYLSGPELSIDGLLTEGELTPVAIFDKPAMPDGPTFDETLLVTPSRLPESVLATAMRTAGHAAQALGLRTGPVHAELRITSTGPAMLELAARSIGGLCSRALSFPGARAWKNWYSPTPSANRCPPPTVSPPPDTHAARFAADLDAGRIAIPANDEHRQGAWFSLADDPALLDAAAFAQGGPADGLAPDAALAAPAQAACDLAELAAVTDNALLGLVGKSRRLAGRAAAIQQAPVDQYAGRRVEQDRKKAGGLGFNPFPADDLAPELMVTTTTGRGYDVAVDAGGTTTPANHGGAVGGAADRLPGQDHRRGDDSPDR